MPKISEEQREARRLQILDVAARCFARQGFHRTTMEDIVRTLKSSPGAVYCYFRGKNDIVEAIAEQRHNRESALLAELLASGNVAEGLQHLARTFFEMLQDPKERERRKVTIQIWAESLRDKRIRKIVERPPMPSPRLLLPIMEASSVEDNETLQDMWAGLLATASQETDAVWPSFVETLKQLTPDEARYLQRLHDHALTSIVFHTVDTLVHSPCLHRFRVERAQ
jgi:AcrR family transcriptional regulator